MTDVTQPLILLSSDSDIELKWNVFLKLLMAKMPEMLLLSASSLNQQVFSVAHNVLAPCSAPDKASVAAIRKT